ncbi:hypothetical protein PTKIN_Ptkin11bG0132900 [Pterospermum kingtungense]
MDQDMEEQLEDLSLDFNDDEELELDSGNNNQNPGRIDLYLVGRFFTDKSINFNAMRTRMAEIWRPVKGVHVKDSQPNLYLFQFFHEIDIQRVMNGGPSLFDNFPLIHKRLQEGDMPTMV